MFVAHGTLCKLEKLELELEREVELPLMVLSILFMLVVLLSHTTSFLTFSSELLKSERLSH